MSATASFFILPTVQVQIGRERHWCCIPAHDSCFPSSGGCFDPRRPYQSYLLSTACEQLGSNSATRLQLNPLTTCFNAFRASSDLLVGDRLELHLIGLMHNHGLQKYSKSLQAYGGSKWHKLQVGKSGRTGLRITAIRSLLALRSLT